MRWRKWGWRFIFDFKSLRGTPLRLVSGAVAVHSGFVVDANTTVRLSDANARRRVGVPSSHLFVYVDEMLLPKHPSIHKAHAIFFIFVLWSQVSVKHARNDSGLVLCSAWRSMSCPRHFVQPLNPNLSAAGHCASIYRHSPPQL